MTSGINSFSPKVIRRLKLRQHCPSHVHQGPVLPLGYTILLRSVGSQVLMTYPFITQELIQCVVLELHPIVTSNHQDILAILMFNFLGEVLDGLLGLVFVLEEVDPCTS
jgi:hypothetical protein